MAAAAPRALNAQRDAAAEMLAKFQQAKEIEPDWRKNTGTAVSYFNAPSGSTTYSASALTVRG